jgi:hypothetical protein
MRGILRRLLRAPALWYGLLGCTFLAVISILPAAMERWAPDAHLELGLTSYATVPNLEWQLLLIVLAITGVATAWHSGRIDFALLVVVCSALGS